MEFFSSLEKELFPKKEARRFKGLLMLAI